MMNNAQSVPLPFTVYLIITHLGGTGVHLVRTYFCGGFHTA